MAGLGADRRFGPRSALFTYTDCAIRRPTTRIFVGDGDGSASQKRAFTGGRSDATVLTASTLRETCIAVGVQEQNDRGSPLCTEDGGAWPVANPQGTRR